MKVLIVGSGGREHAIATCVAKSKRVSKLYCAPGNAGIAKLAECEPIGVMDFDKIVAFGDNLNDIPLFEIADECYAVSNSAEELKKIATGVIGSNDEDAVAEFLLNRFKNNCL